MIQILLDNTGCWRQTMRTIASSTAARYSHIEIEQLFRFCTDKVMVIIYQGVGSHFLIFTDQNPRSGSYNLKKINENHHFIYCMYCSMR